MGQSKLSVNIFLKILAIAFMTSLSVSTSCAQSVKRVENGGLLFTDNPVGIDGLDAGYSIPIGKQTLWLFGDVFIHSLTDLQKPVVGTRSNIGLLLNSGHGSSTLSKYQFLTDPKTGLPRQLILDLPGDNSKVRYWPFGGYYNSRSKRIYLYYARVTVTGNGPLAFRTEGYGLAAADATQPEQIEFKRVDATPGQTIWWVNKSDSDVYGQAVVSVKSSDYTYIVGVRNNIQRKQALMARVRPNAIGDKREYEYYSGAPAAAVWSKDPALATPIIGLSDFPSELSIAWNPYLKAYLSVQSISIFDRIRFCVSPNPWGPYRTIGEISAPHKVLGKGFTYAAKEHPELAEDNGRIIYVTHADSERYWLKLLKVTLEK